MLQDQTILLHQRLMEILQDYTINLAEDLKAVKDSMKAQSRASDAVFRGMASYMDGLRSTFSSMMQDLSVGLSVSPIFVGRTGRKSYLIA